MKRHFYSGCILEGPSTQLSPVAAFMSSKPASPANRERLGAEKCIDGKINLESVWEPNFSLCHTSSEKAPWLAIDYGANVAVQEIVLYNRYDCCHNYFKNAEIRLADELPTSGAEKFSGGELLGTFAGPGTQGERIVVQSQPGWEKKSGRYLIVQISGKSTILHLREVFATGNPCVVKEASRSPRSAGTTETALPGTAHGCLFRDERDIIGNFFLVDRQFGPSGEAVVNNNRIKVKTADDCAKACSLEEECDAFAFSSFQSNPTKDCVLVKNGGLAFGDGCGGASVEGCGGRTMAGFCPKKEGKKNYDGLEDDEYEYVNPDEADFVCDTLCKLVEGCTSWKFQIAPNHNNCKLLFTTTTSVRKDIAHGCLMKENRQIFGNTLRAGIRKETEEECAEECSGAVDTFYNLRCDTFYFDRSSVATPGENNCFLNTMGGIDKGYACDHCVSGWCPHQGKDSARMKGSDPTPLTDIYTWVETEEDCATLCNLSSGCSSYKLDQHWTDLPGNCQLLYEDA